jgi:hypothetical protein
MQQKIQRRAILKCRKMYLIQFKMENEVMMKESGGGDDNHDGDSD